MKKQFSSIALLLAILFTSCSSGSFDTTVPSTDTTTAAPETDPFEELPKIDYEGREFCFVGRLTYEDELCVDEQNGDRLNDVVYERNQKIQEKYNVKFTWVIGPSESTNFGMTEILAGEDVYDALEIHSRNAYIFLINDLLLEWSDNMPYINFNAPWWNQDMKNNITIGDKIFFMSGDISYYFLADTSATLFNKRIADDLQLPSLYQTVRDGAWTFEKMAQIAEMASYDLNGDGLYDPNEDDIGYITTQWRGPTFVHISQGERLLELDKDGLPTIALNLDKAASIYERYLAFLRSPSAEMLASYNDMCIQFKNGNVMFFDAHIKQTTNLRDMNDDYGILPMPKYDETQENYLSTPGAGINFYAVPITVKDSECTSLILESLAILGHTDVMPEYYNFVLQGKNVRDEESSEMLDIIRENIIVDLGAIMYSHTDVKINSIGWYLAGDETLNFASFYAANIGVFNEKLSELIEYLQSGD